MTSLKIFYASVFAFIAVNLVQNSYQQDLAKLPEIEGYKFHCVEASGIKEAAAKKLKNGEEITNPEQPTKCYVQCFFQRLRLMNEKGEVQNDKVVKFLAKVMDEDKAKALAKKCEVRRTNPCDTAYDMYVCYQKNKAKLL